MYSMADQNFQRLTSTNSMHFTFIFKKKKTFSGCHYAGSVGGIYPMLTCCYSLPNNPECANRNKSRLFSRLFFSSAEVFKKPLWLTVWTHIRLLLYEQSDLGPPCLLLYLNSSAMLGNYVQQTTSADVIFQMHLFFAL